MSRLLLIALLSGCVVSKTRADRLEGRLWATRVAYDHRLAAEVRACERTSADYERQLGALEQQIVELELERERVDAKLATRVSELERLRESNGKILRDRGRLRGDISAMQEALAELEHRREQAEERVRRFRELVERFRGLIDAGTLEVSIIDGRMVVSMPSDILFRSGSARLSPDGRDALKQVGELLAGLADGRFQVEGHTDNVPIRNRKYASNWYLASARAIGVVEILVSSGLKASQVSAASYSDSRPRDTNRTPAGRARNRRIEIVVVPQLEDLPGFEELEALTPRLTPR